MCCDTFPPNQNFLQLITLLNHKWQPHKVISGWQHSVVVSMLALINIVNRHWARLVWVTGCRLVNHLGM